MFQQIFASQRYVRGRKSQSVVSRVPGRTKALFEWSCSSSIVGECSSSSAALADKEGKCGGEDLHSSATMISERCGRWDGLCCLVSLLSSKNQVLYFC